MTRIDPKKRLGTITVLVVVVPLLTVALYVGVPYTLMRLGLARQCGWSFGRVGYKELNRQTDYSVGRHRFHPLHSGPVVATAGESLVLDYHVAPKKSSKAPLRLQVRKMFTSHVVWRESFAEPATGREVVRLPSGHFFTIDIGYDRFLGRATIHWSVR